MGFKPKYLRKITASRGIRPVGEVFAMHLRDTGYLFGRVIRNDCAIAGITDPRPWPRHSGLYLVYVYKEISDSIGRIPMLKRDELLIPPQIIGGSGWKYGYFAPVRQDVLGKRDILPVHCFYEDTIQLASEPGVVYLDEYGNRLAKRSEPCAAWGLGEYGSIETDVAKALGLRYPERPSQAGSSRP